MGVTLRFRQRPYVQKEDRSIYLVVWPQSLLHTDAAFAWKKKPVPFIRHAMGAGNRLELGAKAAFKQGNFQ
jgi:hypothetical protein